MNDLFKALNAAVDQRVTFLSLDNVMGDGFASDEVDAVVEANASAEDSQDVAETAEAIASTEASADQVEDLGSSIESSTDAEVTMESLFVSLEKANRFGGLTPLAATWARQTLSSATNGCGFGREAGYSMVPDMQGFSSPSDAAYNTEVTMLGVKDALQAVGDFIYTTTATITQHIVNWKNNLEKAIGKLGVRAAKMRGKNESFKETGQTGQVLSATSANIELAQALFLGPQDHKIDGIFKRMDLLTNVVHTYLQAGVNEADALAEKIAQTAGSLVGDSVDGAMFNSLHAIASKIAKKQHVLPDGRIIHMTEELFEGEAFAISAEKPAKTYTTAELVAYGRSYKVSMYPVNKRAHATIDTWHQYALKGMNKGEVSKALDKVDALIAALRIYAQSSSHQVDMGKKLIALGKAGTKGAGRAGRAALRAAITIWRASCSGAHQLTGHAIEVCHNVLTYVGRSVYLLERVSSSVVGDFVRNTDGYQTAGGAIVGGVVGGAIDAVKRKRWDRAAAQHAGL